MGWIMLLVMLAVVLDQKGGLQCALGEYASQKARRRMRSSFEILVVLEHTT